MESQAGDVGGVAIAGVDDGLVANSQSSGPGAAFGHPDLCQVAISDVPATDMQSLGLCHFWLVCSASMPLVM